VTIHECKQALLAALAGLGVARHQLILACFRLWRECATVLPDDFADAALGLALAQDACWQAAQALEAARERARTRKRRPGDPTIRECGQDLPQVLAAAQAALQQLVSASWRLYLSNPRQPYYLVDAITAYLGAQDTYRRVTQELAEAEERARKVRERRERRRQARMARQATKGPWLSI
jgi:hypothetical protein